MDALQHQFEQGMNSDKFSANLLSPKAQTVLQRIGGKSSETAIPEFATEAEAAKAGLQPGTRVKIGGQTGTWH
jgi:hypothetical protein